MSQQEIDQLKAQNAALSNTNTQLETKLQQSAVELQTANAKANEPLFSQFAVTHKEHMTEVQRQFEVSNIVASLHTFDGLSKKFFKKWLKDLDRVWLHYTEDLFMRMVIFRTVKT